MFAAIAAISMVVKDRLLRMVVVRLLTALLVSVGLQVDQDTLLSLIGSEQFEHIVEEGSVTALTRNYLFFPDSHLVIN
jgi:hypothetical protein